MEALPKTNDDETPVRRRRSASKQDSNANQPVQPTMGISVCTSSSESSGTDSESSESDRGNKRKRKKRSRKSKDRSESDSEGECSDDFRVKKKKHGKKRESVKKHVRRRRRAMYHGGADNSNDESSYSESDEIPEELHYRSNVQNALLELRKLKLTPAHIERIKLTPFWYFIEAAFEMTTKELSFFKKHDGTTVEIIRRYNWSSRKGDKGFKIGGVVVKPRRGDVDLIFGVRGGSDKIYVSNGSIELNSFVERCFPEKARRIIDKISGDYLLRKRRIVDSLTSKLAIVNPDKVVCEDIARLIHMLLLAVLFTPNQNYLVPWSVTEYLVDFDRICLFDWGGHILKTLLNGIKRAKNYRVTGCSVFLLFWICEIVPIIEPRTGRRMFPRFLKWDVQELKRKLLRRNIDQLGEEYIIQKGIFPTIWEVARLDGVIPGLDSLDSDFAMKCPNDTCKVPASVDIANGVDDTCEVQEVVNADRLDAPGSTSMTGLSVGDDDEDQNQQPAADLVIETEVMPVKAVVNDGIHCDTLGGSPCVSPQSASDCVGKPSASKTPEGPDVNGTINWMNYLDFELPSFELLSPGGKNSKVTVGEVQPGNGESDMVGIPKSNEVEGCKSTTAASNSEIETLRQQILKLEAQLDLSEALGLQTQNEEQQTYISELESKLAKLDSMLKDCESARNRMVSKITMLDVGKQEAERQHFQIQTLYDKERARNLQLDTQNSLFAEEVDVQKCRITELIMECDFLRNEVKCLKETVDKLEKHVVQGDPPPRSTVSKSVVNLDETPSTKAIVCYNTPLKPANLFAASPLSCPSSGAGGNVNVSLICDVNATTPVTRCGAAGVQQQIPNLNNSPIDLVTPQTLVSLRKNPASYNSVIVINSGSPISDSVRVARQYESMAIEAIEKVPRKGCLTLRKLSPSGVKGSDNLRAMLLNRKKEAVQHLDIIATTWYANQFKVTKDSVAILKLMTSYATSEICLGDIEKILNHDRYNEAIVDTWALLIQQQLHGQQTMKDTRRNVGAKPFIFRSLCWKYVACFDVDTSYKRGCTVFVDDKIPDAVNYEHWIIPLNTSSSKNPHDSNGDNWTLLHYDLRANYWTFYNSRHVGRIDEDVHLHASNVLINFIENRIRHFCDATGRRLPVYFESGKVGSNQDTPRQPRNAFDCGTVICSVIEKLIGCKQVTPCNWTANTAGRYRAYMAKAFYDVIMKRGI